MRVIVRLSAFVSLGGLLGCGGQGATPRFPKAPIVLISIDTLRADHLPAYGYKGVDTPQLDALRREAILFENAYSHVPLTFPSHVSILTGQLPFEHGARDNLGYQVDGKKHPMLQRMLKQAGYATGAAVSAWVMRGASGLSDGFDTYDDRVGSAVSASAAGSVQRPGIETTAAAKAWLAGVKDRPFFLFLHVYEPHSPYDPPEPYRGRYAPYDGEIAASDAVVGDLLTELRRLGAYDRSIVVVLSDHGEGLGEHGEDEHGILLYRWALHVPLLVKLPKSERSGTTVSEPVGLVDLVPTLTRLVGLTPPKGLRGRSVFDAAPTGNEVYAETYYPRIHLGWSELRSVTDARYQYIEGVRRELYDVAQDPRELTDLVSQQAEASRVRQKVLMGFPAELTMPSEASGEDAERLAALGYLTTAVRRSGGVPPDPRQSIPVLREVKAAFRLADDDRAEEAVASLRHILERFPDLFDARCQLAQTLVNLDRYDEAYQAYRAALLTSPSLAAPMGLEVGKVCLKLGRFDEAAAHARLAERATPAQAHELLARIALARDDLATAEREARGAKGDARAEASAAVVLAEVSIRRDRFADALGTLAEAEAAVHAGRLELVPDLAFLRGDALARLGRYGDAQAAFEEEIRRYPKNSQAYARLAIIHGIQRRSVRDVDRVLTAMVAAHPTPETVELAAKTLESMGDAAGARSWRRRARRASPDAS